MKKLIILTLILTAFIAQSCKKTTDDNDDNTVNTGTKETLITEYEVSTALGSTTVNITYNKSLLPEKLVTIEQNVVNEVKKYTYNGSKILNAKIYSDEAMTTEVGTETFTYNGTGQIISIVKVENAETTTYNFTYTSGKITEMVALVSGAAFSDQKKVYEWTGDNITKVSVYVKDTADNFVLESYEKYTFDSKLNPFVVKVFPDYDDPMFINKNNTTKIEFYDIYDVQQGQATFTYTYSDKNFPLTGTFDYAFISGMFKFTYSELSKE